MKKPWLLIIIALFFTFFSIRTLAATPATNVCGNGINEYIKITDTSLGREACDDGNVVSGDGCSNLCEVEVGYRCAQKILLPKVTVDQQGDLGFKSIMETKDTCVPDSAAAVCGDGLLDIEFTNPSDPTTPRREQCDDGNTTSGDGCNSTCKLESGYNSQIILGNPNFLDPVATTLFTSRGPLWIYPNYLELTCGNGKVELGEVCDDGNSFSGDGCSNLCKIESDFSCNNYNYTRTVCAGSFGGIDTLGFERTPSSYWSCDSNLNTPGATSISILTLCTYAPKVDAICDSVKDICKAGTFEDSTDTMTDYNWMCKGLNGGANVNCSSKIPVNGSCSTVKDTCTTGTLSDVADSSTDYKWVCKGEYNGTDSAECASKIPVNGSCSTVKDTCTTGTFTDVTDTTTDYLWSCKGVYGGTDATSCKSTKVVLATTGNNISINLMVLFLVTSVFFGYTFLSSKKIKNI